MVLVPVFLIASNVRWVINAPFLYSYGFDKYDISYFTGIERDELISAARQLRDYFNDDEELIRIQVELNGIEVYNLYNDREVRHMKDVKGLVKGVYVVQALTGLYIVGFAAVGLFTRRREFVPKLSKYAALGGGATLGLLVLVGLVSLIGFDKLFLLFHLISFSNDLWQLDPRRDYLIAMFPMGFFFDATMWIALSTIFEAILLTVVPLGMLRLRRQKNITRAERRTAARA